MIIEAYFPDSKAFQEVRCPFCGYLENLDTAIFGWWECQQCSEVFFLTEIRAVSTSARPFQPDGGPIMFVEVGDADQGNDQGNDQGDNDADQGDNDADNDQGDQYDEYQDDDGDPNRPEDDHQCDDDAETDTPPRGMPSAADNAYPTADDIPF